MDDIDMNIMVERLNNLKILKNAYQEILKLDKMLTDNDIPHTLRRSWDGWQVWYPSPDLKECIADVIEFTGSYGAEDDLCEMMGLLTPEEQMKGNTVVGYLTAEEICKRMTQHYCGKKKSNG